MAPDLDGTLDDATAARPAFGTTEACQLFVAFECARPLAAAARHALEGVDEVRIGRGSARTAERFVEAGRRILRILVPDQRISSKHARLLPSYGRWVLEDSGSTNGTRVRGRSVTRHTLNGGDVVEVGQTLLLFRDHVPMTANDPLDFDSTSSLGGVPGLLTLNLEFRQELLKLERLAHADIGFLVLGESGTGKEVLAQAIARLSCRPGEFVAVNCGAIPETLIEGELFGTKKGAFTGADSDRPGLVLSSDKGVLFLDEIADLPKSSQAALLRVLQEREVRPVGGTRSTKVDLRVISATHQNLAGMVAGADFRTDLFARLAGHTIHLPPLRERREDLGLLVAVLLGRIAGERAAEVRFEPAAARALFAFDWPLNVRELHNCLTAATTLAADRPVALVDLPEAVREPELRPQENRFSDLPVRALDAEQMLHREELVALFQAHRGNVSAVARAAGRARMQIQRWIKRYAIDPNSFR